MKSKTLTSAVRVLSLLLFVSATCAIAQERKPVHFSGLFNDYEPTNPLIAGTPWEMHGQWSMDVRPEWGTADFAADMTMSGYGMTPEGAPDAIQGGQMAHTHHIKLTNIKIIWGIVGCPPYPKPVPTGGFQIMGTVSLITGNGQLPTFETTPPSSTLQVCVLGGSLVPFSNVTLVFGGPAALKHFGSQPIHGVVRTQPTEPFEKYR